MIGAVDIGGTKIAVGVVSHTGQVLAQRSSPTQASRGAQDALLRIQAMLLEAQAEAALNLPGAQQALEGIGIGITGRVSPLDGRLGRNDVLPGWEGINLPAELTRLFGVSAAIENDADAAALGEFAWGAGQGARNFIMVTVGTGIGGGVVLGGQLYRGLHQMHPEIGHHVVDPSGPLCFCGGHGCLEVLASGSGMAAYAKTVHPQGRSLSARELCQMAEDEDAFALGVVARSAAYLGIGIANLINIFVPDVVALGGGMMQSAQLFMPAVQRAVHQQTGLVGGQGVRLVPVTLGAQAGLVGAAQVWRSRQPIQARTSSG